MKLNNKGFTLIEVISVVVILGIIAVITFPIIGDYFSASEEKSEEIFVKETSRIIDAYISLEGRKLNFNNGLYTKVNKCEFEDDPDTCKLVSVYRSLTPVSFQNIIDSELLNKNDLINPKGKKKCDVNTNIEIYRDEDYVYCYRTNLDCVVTENTSTYDIDTCVFVDR